MDEHKGPATNSQVEQLEKSQALLGEKMKETDSRLASVTTSLSTLDTEIALINGEIATVTKNRNAVDAEVQSLGNQYDEVRLSNRIAMKKASQPQPHETQTQSPSTA
jgi:chromosome segregation ATPase